MTSSLSLRKIARSSILRGVDTRLVRNLFKRRRLESPLLLISRAEILRNYRALSAALPRAQIHYAVKSNNHPVFLGAFSNAIECAFAFVIGAICIYSTLVIMTSSQSSTGNP